MANGRFAHGLSAPRQRAFFISAVIFAATFAVCFELGGAFVPAGTLTAHAGPNSVTSGVPVLRGGAKAEAGHLVGRTFRGSALPARPHSGTVRLAEDANADLEAARGKNAAAATLTIAGALVAACVAVRVIPALVQKARFVSDLRKFMFGVFLACSILWFLSPSALATRVHGFIRPFAMRFAFRGQHRRAAMCLAACDFCSAATTGLQAFIAASIAVAATPELVAKFAPALLPTNAMVMTGPHVPKLLGFWLAPLASIGAFTLQAFGVLLQHRVWLLMTVFMAPQAARFTLAATAPKSRVIDPNNKAKPVIPACIELLRTVVAAGAVYSMHLAGAAAVGRPAAYQSLVFAVALVVSSPLVRDVLARLVSSALKRPVVGDAIRGHVGGQFVSGTFRGFNGRSAEVTLADGAVAHLGAFAAALLVRRERILNASSVSSVNVGAAIEAVMSASQPKKKSVLPKLLVAVLAATMLYKSPQAACFAFPLFVTIYVCKLVLPRILVLVVTLVALWSNGPVGSQIAGAVLTGFVLASLPSPSKAPGTSVVCSSLDLKSSTAEVSWRTAQPDEDAAKFRAAASGSQGNPAAAVQKLRKKSAAQAVIALALCCLCFRFNPTLHWFEAVTATRPEVRFAVLGAASAVMLKLFLAGKMANGLRQVLPLRFGGLCSAPAGAANWFLLVNIRAALAGTVMGWLLPKVGLIQALMYNYGVSHQIRWFDSWLFQLSRGFVLAVLLLQGASFAISSLPWRPKSMVAQLTSAVARAGVCAAAVAALEAVVPTAIGATKPEAAMAAIIIAASLGAMPALAWDWLARGCLPAAGIQVGSRVWVPGADGRTVVPARILGFQGRYANLRESGSGDTRAVGASSLLGAACLGVRRVCGCIPVGDKDVAGRVASAVEAAMKRLGGKILHRPPFTPSAVVDEDGSVHMNAFVDRRLPPDDASSVRSALLVAAAAAAATIE